MVNIIPAIIAKDYTELQERVAKFVSLVDVVQIDVCDGNFVPPYSWPMQREDEKSIEAILNEEEGMPNWDKIDFEFDLMVANASQKFDFFVRLGAKRIIFHLEAEFDKNKFKEFLEGLDMYVKENVEIGLAINTTTSILQLEPYINHVDFIQCMGIENLGFQGEPFDERVLGQIKDLRLKYRELIISVDGGVDENTAPQLIKAGANRLVVGHALMESYNIRETLKELEGL